MKWTIVEHGRKPELTHIPYTLLRCDVEVAHDIDYITALELVATECLGNDRITEQYTSSGRTITRTGKELREELARIRAFDEGQG